MLYIKSIEYIIAFILGNNKCITNQLSQRILSRNIVERVSNIQNLDALMSQHLTRQWVETNQVSKLSILFYNICFDNPLPRNEEMTNFFFGKNNMQSKLAQIFIKHFCHFRNIFRFHLSKTFNYWGISYFCQFNISCHRSICWTLRKTHID